LSPGCIVDKEGDTRQKVNLGVELFFLANCREQAGDVAGAIASLKGSSSKRGQP